MAERSLFEKIAVTDLGFRILTLALVFLWAILFWTIDTVTATQTAGVLALVGTAGIAYSAYLCWVYDSIS